MNTFDERLARSSLGTEGAKQLIARTPRKRGLEAVARAQKLEQQKIERASRNKE